MVLHRPSEPTAVTGGVESAKTGRHMSGKPTTQESVERPGRGSLRARWSEVESKGKSEQLHAHFVVRRKVPHILVQLEIGQLARSDRPARDDGQCKNS